MNINPKILANKVAMQATFTEMNNLGANLRLKPDLLSDKVTQLFSGTLYSDNPLTSALSGKHTITVNQNSWEWKARGGGLRPTISYGNLNTGNAKPGFMRGDFFLWLDENYWVAGDVLSPGTVDKTNAVRVVSNPERHGKGWKYLVRGMWDQDTKFLPVALLNENQQWGKLYSQYGEGATQSGSTQVSNAISLNGRLSRYRKHYMVTGDVHNAALACAIPDDKGKYHLSWMPYLEAQYWQQWHRELEIGYWYSRYTDTVKDSEGRPIYSGSGVQELLEGSNIYRHNGLSIKLFEEYMMDIFYARTAPMTGKRTLRGYTGEYGMLEFHRMIDLWQSRRKGAIQIMDSNYDRVKSPYSDRAYSAGYQYTKLRLFNGLEIELIHLPLYDDPTLNFEIDPASGRLKESSRITFLDFLDGEGDSNIKLVKRKDAFKNGYVAGMTSPYGNANKGLMSHAGDYYEMHVQDEVGVQITDTTRCGELILA